MINRACNHVLINIPKNMPLRVSENCSYIWRQVKGYLILMTPLNSGLIIKVSLSFHYYTNLSSQAMSVGTPVIARDIPGNCGLIVNNVSGLLYNTPQVSRTRSKHVQIIRIDRSLNEIVLKMNPFKILNSKISCTIIHVFIINCSFFLYNCDL